MVDSLKQEVGRNAPCPCGSGKKYKHCCGRSPSLAQVLYVHPAKQEVNFFAQHFGSREVMLGRPYGVIPVGLPALINVLRAQDISVRGVNYPMERQLDPAFDLRAWLEEQRGAYVILIDMHWYEHSYGAISVARLCKEVLPDAWTVLGGLTATGFSKEILQGFPTVDFVIRGDAERPLLALTQRILAKNCRPGDALDVGDIPNLSYRQAGDIFENARAYCAATSDLDDLNYADVDFLVHYESYLAHEYIVTDIEVARQAMKDGDPFQGRWLCTARGCKYECSYCGGCRSAHSMLAGREGIVSRTPEAVVAELQRLAEQGVRQASCSYDIAEMGKPYWRKFFAVLRKSGIDMGLYNEFFQLPPDGFIKDFARSVNMEHSCLAVSPLSGSEQVRRLNGKPYSNRELFNTLDYLNLYSVPIFVYFSLNLPGEDETTIKETVALAQRIYMHYPSSLLKILNTCHTLDPLSPMQRHPEKYGISVSMKTFRDFYDYCRETQTAGPDARTGKWRGFALQEPDARSLARMADAWDAGRPGREASWWPIPPSW